MSNDIDERLAAWLDGALSPEEAAAFEREMEADPALARRAQEWRANDAFIAAALAPIAAAPIGDDLLARMGLGDPAPAAAPPPPVAANDNPPWWRRHGLPLGGALAAGLAAVLLLATPRGGAAPDDFSLALDTTPSLQKARLADGRVIEPTLTVRAADGRWCREFRSGAQSGLACRDEDGWQVEATSDRSGPADQGEISLAGGADGAALDAAYRRIGASDPLGAGEEAGLIARGWGDR
jgi:Putative zinc-finger